MPPRWQTHPNDVSRAAVQLPHSKKASSAALWESTSLLFNWDLENESTRGLEPGTWQQGPRQILTAQSLCVFIPCYLLFRAPPRIEIYKELRYQTDVKHLRSRQALRRGLLACVIQSLFTTPPPTSTLIKGMKFWFNFSNLILNHWFVFALYC